MEETNNFTDPEFPTIGNEKIDFQTILFRCMESVRVARSADMGEALVFDFKVNAIPEEHLLKVITNINRYQNCVKSFSEVLFNFRDKKFITNINNIKIKYKNAKINIIKKKKTQTLKYNKNMLPLEYYEWEKNKLKELSLLHSVKMYVEIYGECLALAKRAKFLGGTDIKSLEL